MKIIKDFPLILQKCDWDCGVACCLMYANYIGERPSRRSVINLLGADRKAPSVVLRHYENMFPECFKGSFPTDMWAFFAQYWTIPQRIDESLIPDQIKVGEPILYLCEDFGHWAWITGCTARGWRIHCPTIGIHFEKVIKGVTYQLVPFEGSFSRAYALGTMESVRALQAWGYLWTAKKLGRQALSR